MSDLSSRIARKQRELAGGGNGAAAGANGSEPTAAEEPTGPFAVPLGDFIADKREAPDPLLGTRDDCILPALGLGLLIAKGGKGKTTFTVDLVLHLATGVEYLELEVARPLPILFIENEGPREPFRRKLERKLASWSRELRAPVHVFDQDWGQARLDLPGFVERLNAYCGEHRIELVIGDPLDSLGMVGEGSPSETREMVDRFKAAGLFTQRAWLVPHHSRKESIRDAVDEASGAWGGRPDAMLALEKKSGNQARLTFSKVRWQGRERQPYLLDFDPATESFTFAEEEEGEQRDYVVQVEEYLSEHPYQTAKEIATEIKASADKVREALARPDRFRNVTGEEAKAVGRHSSAVLWLTSGLRSPESGPYSQGELAAEVTPDFPVKEVRSPEAAPPAGDEVTPTAESAPSRRVFPCSCETPAELEDGLCSRCGGRPREEPA